jgi:DNA-binding response OmpR family regulator
MKILVIEDERKLARFIGQGLAQAGHVADLCHSGSAGLDQLAGGLYDLVLLDLMLPGQTGFEVLKNMRAFGLHVPVVIMSALSDPATVVQGLDLGAVDYLRKPFDFDELLARVRVWQRQTTTGDAVILRVGELEMRLATREVLRYGHRIELTNREFALLELLMRQAGRVVTRNEIAEKVWDVDYDRGSNVIDVHMYQLRKKLDIAPPVESKTTDNESVMTKNRQPALIETLVGQGYRLNTP